MAPNRYPGDCPACHRSVEAGAGLVVRSPGGRWYAICAEPCSDMVPVEMDLAWRDTPIVRERAAYAQAIYESTGPTSLHVGHTPARARPYRCVDWAAVRELAADSGGDA